MCVCVCVYVCVCVCVCKKELAKRIAKERGQDPNRRVPKDQIEL